MSAARAEWTVDMLDALPDDGQRYELVDGIVHVTPALGLPHQLIMGDSITSCGSIFADR